MEFKVKFYKDNQRNLQGDGLCSYLKRESVDFALILLNEVTETCCLILRWPSLTGRE